MYCNLKISHKTINNILFVMLTQTISKCKIRISTTDPKCKHTFLNKISDVFMKFVWNRYHVKIIQVLQINQGSPTHFGKNACVYTINFSLCTSLQNKSSRQLRRPPLWNTDLFEMCSRSEYGRKAKHCESINL